MTYREWRERSPRERAEYRGMRRVPAALLVLLPGALLAQERDPRAAMPERPTVATHAYTVAPGVIEIETGLERDRFDDGSRTATWASVIKVGLGPRAQLNLSIPATGPALNRLGMGDVFVGVKWRLLDKHPVLGSFAVLPAATIPGAPSSWGSGESGLSLTVISSRDIGPVSIDANVGWTHRSGGGARVPETSWLWTISSGGTLKGNVGWVLEWYGYPATSGPAGSPASSALLFGPTLTLAKWLVLDAGGIVPLSGVQRDGLYAGVTWNVTRL